jgi:spore coat polysaccharide biosynthesis protein SpsF
MRSTRLPGKILEPIAGKPLLDHIVGRLTGLRQSATVTIATSDEQADDAVEAYCEARAVDCFRGSETDVLARFYECARARELDHVVRLTGDNPFTDIIELDRLVELHLSETSDFSSSFEELPIGVGAEIFAFSALERSFRDGKEPHHREHVDEYILENRAVFRTSRLNAPENKRYPHLRLTVDTAEDLRRARYVAERAVGRWITTEEAVVLCSLFV